MAGKPKPLVKDTPKKTQGELRKSKKGRPSTYSVAVADSICIRVASGEALYRICQEAEMPNITTIYDWLRKHPDFAKNYARAKEDLAETYATRIQAIVDETPVILPSGKVDSGWVQLQRLKIDTLKWEAGKLKPKVYGDKIDLNHGGQPDNPIRSLLEQIQGTPMRPGEGNAE